MTAIQIKKVVEMHKHEVQKHDPKILEISYESFVKKTKGNIDLILNFLDLKKIQSYVINI